MMAKLDLSSARPFLIAFFALLLWPFQAHAAFEEYDTAILQSLDKITARTATFEAKVGSTLSYGQVFMKVTACKKRPVIESPEATAFLKVWEVEPGKKPEWIFSGWMFASSPALSAMDHPIYDIWVLDCKNSATTSSSEIDEDSPIKVESEAGSGDDSVSTPASEE